MTTSGLVAVEKAARHDCVAGVRDLRLDGAGAVREVRKRRRAAGDGDDWRTGIGKGGGDSVAEAAAGAHDDRGSVGQVADGLVVDGG
jgi:hypothetical protein